MSEMSCCSRIRQNSAMNNSHVRILTNPATGHLCPREVYQMSFRVHLAAFFWSLFAGRKGANYNLLV